MFDRFLEKFSSGQYLLMYNVVFSRKSSVCVDICYVFAVIFSSTPCSSIPLAIISKSEHSVIVKIRTTHFIVENNSLSNFLHNASILCFLVLRLQNCRRCFIRLFMLIEGEIKGIKIKCFTFFSKKKLFSALQGDEDFYTCRDGKKQLFYFGLNLLFCLFYTNL